MKILSTIRCAVIALAAGVAMASCSDISPEDRYIPLPAVEAKRVVLLEEFTGQVCINCPAAHDVIKGLLAQYPDNLIAVGIHSGGDAFSLSEDEFPGEGLRTVDGQAYCDDNKIAGLPAGVIDRSSGVLDDKQWPAAVRAALEKPSKLEIALDARVSDDGRKVVIDTNILPFEKINGKLQLWIVESGIVAMQIDANGDFMLDYEHNHVLRGAVNGRYGEDVALLPNEAMTYQREITVKDTWNPANLSVVGFVYTDKGVEQAAEVHVKTK